MHFASEASKYASMRSLQAGCHSERSQESLQRWKCHCLCWYETAARLRDYSLEQIIIDKAN
jgi:hypothetical protein